MTKSKSAQAGKNLSSQLRPIAMLESMLGKKSSPLRLLNAARAAVSVMNSDTKSMLEQEIIELENATVQKMSELEADIRDLARINNWRLEGTWPTYQIERGIELRIDAAKRVARVAGTPVDPTDCDAIEEAIKLAGRDLVPKNFSAREMLEGLRRSHTALRPDGGQIPILDLYSRFVIDSQSSRFWRDARSDRFIGLSIDQFRARFSKMLEDGETVARDGSELRMLPPLDPKDALFVYQPAEGRFGHVGRIEFVATRG